MSQPTVLGHNKFPWIIAIISVVLALTLATRGYSGIWHDSTLYTAQALHLLDPTPYANDLFFHYGSQDDYTVFSRLYAAVIELLGIDNAARLLTLAGQILWMTGALLLTRRLLPDNSAWIAIALIIGVLDCYSGNNVFIMREPFLTSRLYAEGLSLLALYAFLQHRMAWALIAITAAAALHILNSLPVILLGFFMLLLYRPRLGIILGATGLVLVLTLAVIGIAPASALFKPIDVDWFSITRARSPHLYISYLDYQYWNPILITITALFAGATRGPVHLRRLYWAALLTIAFGIGSSWWASETLSSLLIIQLQLWRAVWLGMVLGVTAVVGVTWQAYNRNADPIITLAIAASLLHNNIVGVIINLAIIIYMFIPCDRIAAIKKWLYILLIALTLVGMAEYLALSYIYYSATIPLQFSVAPHSLLPQLVVIISIGLLLYLGMSSVPDKFMIIYFIVSLFTLILSATVWNHQPESTLLSSQDSYQIQQLQQMIGKDETVYWGASPYNAWFLLNRSSYYSAVQAAGAIFNRQTAIEAAKRNFILSQLYVEPEKVRSSLGGADLRVREDLSKLDLEYICVDPALHWLALNIEIPGWKTVYTSKTSKWYFYQCSHYRPQSFAENNKS